MNAFAHKFAANNDVHGVAGCLVRFAQALALFALNRVYPMNDKTTMSEIEEFTIAPDGFRRRGRSLLPRPGLTPEAQGASVDAVAALFEDVHARAGSSYRPTWRPQPRIVNGTLLGRPRPNCPHR